MPELPSYILEKESVWDFLRRTELPVFIYGMGDGAEKILAQFDTHGIPVAGFFASDEFVRGHSFKGHLVHTLSQIEALIDDFIIVLGFGAGYRSLYDRINEISLKHTLFAPDVPVIGKNIFDTDFVRSHLDEINEAYASLADDISRQMFANILNFKICGKISYLRDLDSTSAEDYALLNIDEDTVYADLGAFTGDTVEEFCAYTEGRYKRIIAVEPSPKNFRRMVKNIAEKNILNVEAVNAAASDKDGTVSISNKRGRMPTTCSSREDNTVSVPSVRVDTLLSGADAQNVLVKFDVEGAEADAIAGAENAIRGGAKLIVSVYHRSEDIFDLLLRIKKLSPDRKFYLRKRMYIPAWDVNLIVI